MFPSMSVSRTPASPSASTRPAGGGRRLAPVVLALLLLAALAVPAAAADWTGRIEEIDGVTHIWNPAQPMTPDEALTPEALWTVGGYSENEGEFFGVLRSVVTDTEGNVYLLDVQLSEIRVFDADGNYLRTIGREGEGPGEFRRPRSMFFLPGGALAVVQLMPGQLVLLTPEGEPAGDFKLPEIEGGGMRLFFDGHPAGDLIALFSRSQGFGEGRSISTNLLATYDTEGNEVARHFEMTTERDMANFVFDETKAGFITWDTGPDGDLYLVPEWGEYEIQRDAASGDHEMVIHREYEHLKRSGKEMERARSGIVIRGPVDPKIVISEHHPDIARLLPRDDGSLWVLTSRGARRAPDGSLGVFDVYDEDGRFTRRVTLMGEGDPTTDMYRFCGDRLFVLRHYTEAFDSMVGGSDATEEDAEEPEPMKVICYRVPL